MNGVLGAEPDHSEFVEIDPTGRYGRYDEILGKGASKTVYRAFDEYEGIEVAWNQVKLYDLLQSPEDLERLYCEIHLLKTLRHRNIMKFYTSWVDIANRNINFVTEMFTSGTLRQYRLKHKRVNIRAVKHWCRQILKGLVYLHSLDPPVIHRDLKCDNIFINGNQGEVKIGDLGLAAILKKSYAARCVGTPEFMAPEVYEEEYNELVDIYSFGMCVLEMVTFEYPYSECTHPAQIYKKGKKPEALYKVKDTEVRQFVEKCLATVSLRLTANELLEDPFLQIDDQGFDRRPIDEFDEVGLLSRQPLLYGYSNHHHSSSRSLPINGYSNCHDYEPEYDLDYYPKEFVANRIDDFTYDDEDSPDVAISIRGRREDDGIFLRLRITDKEGQVKNIFFPFDIETDTALSVATEMVAELDITDQDVIKIADMIDGEIDNLVPRLKEGLGMEEETFHHANSDFCSSNCDYASSNIDHESGAIHGRFEEISYHESPDNWASSESPMEIHSDDETREMLDRLAIENDEEKIITVNGPSYHRRSFSLADHENEIRQELRWLKAKYQMQLREIKDQELLGKCNHSESSNIPKFLPPKSFPFEKQEIRCGNMVNKSLYSEVGSGSFSPDHMFTAKSFYTNALLPHPLHRTSSLPVDAVDL